MSSQAATGGQGVLLEPGTVRFERVLPGPIERVWAFLTEEEKRAEWFMRAPTVVKPGGRMELRFNNSDLSPHKEPTPEKYKECESMVSHATVTECSPPHVFVFEWEEPTSGASEVRFELTNEGEKVRLVLTHRRLAKREDVLGVLGGWHTHLDILVDKVSGRVPPAFWSTHAKWDAQYAARFRDVQLV